MYFTASKASFKATVRFTGTFFFHLEVGPGELIDDPEDKESIRPITRYETITKLDDFPYFKKIIFVPEQVDTKKSKNKNLNKYGYPDINEFNHIISFSRV